MALTLVSTGCTKPLPDPVPPVPPRPTGSATPGAEVTVPYRLNVLDLCKRTDLAPLQDFSLKVRSTDPRSPFLGSGESCLFEFDQANGLPATLQVQALAPPTVEEAKRMYAAQRGTRMTRDTAVSGVGEEAEGFAIETEPKPGFKYGEYRIQARNANLVLDVWLAIGAAAFIPKETLAAKVLAILKNTLATVDDSWRVK
ncbi:hypothetical protein Rhe02_66780 [Rhizocola hellebori]|uniref:Uncharacterized protein n=1 Tax=Rhizocola hellebori TaxID=1392758 RepID=A0A8J3QDD1_9ACTN|nr:hypothetical protein Rhe02_66780 [Rhizocola hellebori]